MVNRGEVYTAGSEANRDNFLKGESGGEGRARMHSFTIQCHDLDKVLAQLCLSRSICFKSRYLVVTDGVLLQTPFTRLVILQHYHYLTGLLRYMQMLQRIVIKLSN